MCNFKAQFDGTGSRSIVVWEEFLAGYSIVKWYQDAGIDATACARLLGVRLPKHWAVEPFRLALSNQNSSRSRRATIVLNGVRRISWSLFLVFVFRLRVMRGSTRSTRLLSGQERRWSSELQQTALTTFKWRAAIQLVSRRKYCVFRAIIVNNLLQRCLTYGKLSVGLSHFEVECVNFNVFCYIYDLLRTFCEFCGLRYLADVAFEWISYALYAVGMCLSVRKSQASNVPNWLNVGPHK